MRYFRDETLMRRALGAAIVFGLLGLWARHWRDSLAARGTYATDTWDAADNWLHTCWAIAVVLTLYVAACLILTPRTTPRVPRHDPHDAVR